MIVVYLLFYWNMLIVFIYFVNIVFIFVRFICKERDGNLLGIISVALYVISCLYILFVLIFY